MKLPSFIALGLLSFTAGLMADTIYQVDFGDSTQTTPNTAGDAWNNMVNSGVAGTNGTNLTAIIDKATATPSGINITYLESGTNAGVAGTAPNYNGPYPTTPVDVSGLPETALKDGLYFQTGVKITLKINGLDPAATYNFILYGARSGTNGGKATYTAEGANTGTGEIPSVLNNSTTAVSITGISPTAAGVIDLALISEVPVNKSGALNVMVMTEVPPPDDDNDGIPNAYETTNGTDPNENGTLGETSPGAKDGPNGALGDKDSDGLTNFQEYKGWNAANTATGYGQTLSGTADSDTDGVNDGNEVSGALNAYDANGIPVALPGASTNPLDFDTDNDTLTDGEELLTHHTSPHWADTDIDTLPDAWEVDNNLNPTVNTGSDGESGDPDADLFTNGREFAAGTDPQDPDSDNDGLWDGDEADGTLNPWSLGVLGSVPPGGDDTDPLDPDSDNDGISDFVEVNNANGSVTDPNSADSDGDGFTDFVEITAGSNPVLAGSVPSFPSIAWSVANFNSAALLSLNGTLLYAQNFNDLSTTVNTIKFDGRTVAGNNKASESILTNMDLAAKDITIYDDEVPELSGLLEGFWYGLNPGDGQITLTGLTPGKTYLVQFGMADDRNVGNIPGRYVTADDFGGEVAVDPLGATNTIYGGSSNPALLFSGTFTAASSVQGFSKLNHVTGDVSSSGSIAFIQVREIEPPATFSIISASFNGANFEVTATGLDTGTPYRLTRSASLTDGFPTVVDGPRAPVGATDVFIDTAPPAGKAFYRLEEAP